MIDCEKAQEFISCLVDGELGEKEQSEVLEHIKTCPECKSVYDAFSAVSENLGELEDAPENLTDNVMSAITAPAKRKTPWIKYLSLAACLALVIFAGTKLAAPDVAKDTETACCDSSATSGECEEASEARDTLENAADGVEFDTYNKSADCADSAVVLVRSDGECVEPDKKFISRLEAEVNAPVTKADTDAQPDYTLSLADGTEFEIYTDGDAVTVHCGDRIYIPDLTAEDIESLFE